MLERRRRQFGDLVATDVTTVLAVVVLVVRVDMVFEHRRSAAGTGRCFVVRDHRVHLVRFPRPLQRIAIVVVQVRVLVVCPTDEPPLVVPAEERVVVHGFDRIGATVDVQYFVPLVREVRGLVHEGLIRAVGLRGHVVVTLPLPDDREREVEVLLEDSSLILPRSTAILARRVTDNPSLRTEVLTEHFDEHVPRIVRVVEQHRVRDEQHFLVYVLGHHVFRDEDRIIGLRVRTGLERRNLRRVLWHDVRSAVLFRGRFRRRLRGRVRRRCVCRRRGRIRRRRRPVHRRRRVVAATIRLPTGTASCDSCKTDTKAR